MPSLIVRHSLKKVYRGKRQNPSAISLALILAKIKGGRRLKSKAGKSHLSLFDGFGCFVAFQRLEIGDSPSAVFENQIVLTLKA